MTEEVMNKEKKLIAINEDVQDMLKLADFVSITNPKDLTEATDFLVKIVTRKKRIEEIRQFFVGPLNSQVKNINAEFKKATEPLLKVEYDIKEKISEYRIKEAKKIEKEEKKSDSTEMVEKQDSVVHADSGSVRARKVWTFKIKTKSKVPKKYWVIDESMIRDAVKKGVRKIAGVEIYQEENISVYN